MGTLGRNPLENPNTWEEVEAELLACTTIIRAEQSADETWEAGTKASKINNKALHNARSPSPSLVPPSN